MNTKASMRSGTSNSVYDLTLVKVVSVLGIVIPLYVCFVDVPLIAIPSHKLLYILGRLLTAIVCSWILFNVHYRNMVKSYQVPALFTILTFYSIHGQFFLACYYLSFMQEVIAFSFFFSMPKRTFYSIAFSGCALMILAILISPATYSSIPEINNKFRFDAILGVLIMTVLAYFGYKHITLTRSNKDRLMDRFLQVGKNNSFIVHEIKNLMSSPAVYFNILKKEMSGQQISPQAKEVFSLLNRDFDNLREYVLNVNSLTLNSNENSLINPSELAQQISIAFFGPQSKKYRIRYLNENAKIYTNINSLRSVLTNLFSNSFDNFKEKSMGDGEIVIDVKENKLLFKDNGGGFSPNALKQIKNDTHYTEKNTGSGIGLYLVKDNLKNQGGAVSVYNEKDWAVVELDFGKIPSAIKK